MIKNQQPIRIAHIIGKMWAGGVEAVVFNYYRAMDHSQFQFDFYYDADSTVPPPEDLIEMGARFFELPPYQKLTGYIKELRKQLKAGHYAIVHSHLNTLSVFPLYAAWREHVPVRIAHNHSVPGGNELKRNAAKNILRQFSRLFSTDYFACSEKAGRWMFGDKTFDSGKVCVLKNAIDFERFQISSDKVKSDKKNLGIEDKFVVGHIGRFTYAKNHDFLLDIFMDIHARRKDSVLLLVGDGELHDAIAEGIRKRGLDGNVILTGKVRNPEDYYKLNDVMVLPSFFEGLSMTTIESQVSGVPAVISRAIPEEAVISNGCAYMDLKESSYDWAETVVGLAGTVVQLNSKAEEYDIKKQAPRLTEWYYRALKERNLL